MSCRSKGEWRQEVARLRSEGCGVKEIARTLKVPLAAVGNTLHTERMSPETGEPRAPAPQAATSIPPRLKAEMTMDELRSDVERDVVGLQRIEDAALEQFRVSCQPRGSITKRSGGPDADEVWTSRRSESVGDVRFLNCAMRCISLRQKLRHSISILTR